MFTLLLSWHTYISVFITVKANKKRGSFRVNTNLINLCLMTHSCHVFSKKELKIIKENN